ncbi:hypothetical protein A3K02_00450 [candidate division WS6 bacterium RIFOXYD1_FULL_33_8]|uniref:Uncharacterized protein n=2 Tax=Candidatus Dojkabacteria TaxID=74243 RepID=A0A0G0DJ81_9BACT|nr:MAG: hypothetical protein UR32_C0003G0008 [candidate division WS6 bacterium GW2011_GWE2_33_157]KKP44411.1 MAG: hypothetical protein UR34_C0003G0037 [candidate division WS6 bacterium GW2011_GWC1_33_20]KKP46041.1 MAG: hypothetical protein UR36_C0002G0083 [candidate division WS6 bacterium GW2011_GWF1_33_233]KKP55447.1 MAG: hypothetical protein UR47_C0001G0008 [candidate division WS6 bacterium GW2011_GWB1_33_6]KKP55526.1 MAG: hypothetical protein UR45_C0001G0008 [candidate division WS6 bacterium
MVQKNFLTSDGRQQVLSEQKVDSNLSIVIYSVKEFLTWWYIRMPLWHLRMLSRIAILVDDNMSLSIVLRNFFLPWHRDFTLIGYVFGILIKTIYIPIALTTYILLCTLYFVVILIWLLLPPATLFLIIRSIISI